MQTHPHTFHSGTTTHTSCGCVCGVEASSVLLLAKGQRPGRGWWVNNEPFLSIRLYQGECVLTVCLEEEEACGPVPDAKSGGGGGGEKVFYLLFSGSTQRHLTTTLRVSNVTLQAVCPGTAHTHICTHAGPCTHTHTACNLFSVLSGFP